MFDLHPLVFFQYLFFAAKYVALLLFISIFCEILKLFLNIKNSYYFAITVWFFSASTTLAFRPHFVFSSTSVWTIYFSSIIAIMSFALFFIAGFVQLLRYQKNINIKKYISAIVIISALFVLNQPGINFLDQFIFKFDNLYKSKNLEKSVIILSIDSLRPDFIERYIGENPNSIFTEFYNESVVFKNVTAPISRTHPSVFSFLTGLNPPEHGIRDNLMLQAKDTEKILSKSKFLTDLNTKKYDVQLILDESKFSHYNESKFMHIAKSPPESVLNHILPQFFKSSLHNIFLNNILGHSVLTELKNNGAFSATYNPKNFYHDVADVLNQLKPDVPFFLLAHTCSMHYPGHSRSEYILKTQSDSDFLATEYINYFSKERKKENIRPEKFKDLAYGNFYLIIDDIIEPLLRNFKKNNLLDRLNVILMSDHGETFYTSAARYNSSYMPAHGNPAILDEDSHKAAFVMHSKNTDAKAINKLTSLTDMSLFIEKMLTGLSFNAEFVTDRGKYYESGIWSKSNFKSQLLYFDRNIEKLYSINEFGNVSLIEKIEPGLIVQKARTLFLENKHYTLFPTDFGIESVTCEGYKCWSDQEINQKFIDDINHFAKPDIDAGYWPSMINKKSSSADFEIDKKLNNTKNQFLTYLLLQHDLNHNGEIFDAIDGLLKILTDTNNDQLVRKKSYQSLSEICRINFLKKSCSDFYDRKYSDRAFSAEKIPQSEIFVDNLIATAQFNALRDYAEKYQNNVFQTGYYYKFWLAYIKLPENLTLDQKIEKLKTTFEIELGLQFFEVDSDWIRFLNHVSSNSDRSYFYAEAAKYLKTGRLPLTVVFNDLLPAVLNVLDSNCYTDKIHRLIFSQRSNWINKSNWSDLVYQMAKANQHLCARK